ncbi:SGNH/GDSL hydrolase family protein [Agromyces sp. NPDC056523]|uniref:SGNH/GDSL hydrolase family protein n=1 Tax=Agromyces sp. NPDC056523 TaxID=3345850 RepID=UPI00366B3BF3
MTRSELDGTAPRPRSAGRGGAVAIVATACLLLAGCAPGASNSDPSGSTDDQPATSDPTAADGPTFAAVGDSITDADSRDFAAGDIGPASWARYVHDAGYGFAGGWAEWGATTAQMAESATSLDADTLVVLGGTNDVAFGVPFAETSANLERIVETVGIEDVVLASVPPMDAFPEGAVELNERLEELADDRGWRFVDASEGLRTDDGMYREGMSFDGLHPSEEGARVLGEAIAEELRDG